MSDDQPAVDTIGEAMEKKGFIKADQINNVDMNQLLGAMRETTFKEAADHKCDDDSCSLCTLRRDIDDAAFRRGLEKGVKLARHLEGRRV